MSTSRELFEKIRNENAQKRHRVHVAFFILDLKMNTILDNAGLGFGLKCRRLVVTGLQHCLVSKILKEKHTVRHLVLPLQMFYLVLS